MKSSVPEVKVPIQGVAPHTGAWIEIFFSGLFNPCDESLPTRERGLKSVPDNATRVPASVAPHTGAWIEISVLVSGDAFSGGRSPHGSVD